MPDYAKAKIYTIRSHQTDEMYIGSTCQKLSVRMAKHRSGYKRYNEGIAKYISSFKILEYGDAYIELKESYPCLCREGLLQKEGEVIRETDNCVNKNVPGRTRQEYRIDNKEKIKQYHKQYIIDNKEKINQRDKQYYIDNKEKINQRVKQYRIDNKDRRKQYYIDNKEKLQEKHECDCGGKYTNDHKSTHLKTKKHLYHIWFMSLTEDQMKKMLHI